MFLRCVVARCLENRESHFSDCLRNWLCPATGLFMDRPKARVTDGAPICGDGDWCSGRNSNGSTSVPVECNVKLGTSRQQSAHCSWTIMDKGRDSAASC